MTAEDFKREAETLLPILTTVAQRYMPRREDAEDVAQDVLMKLWGMLDELHSPMAALARVLTRNFCIDRIRRHHDTVELTPTSDRIMTAASRNSDNPQQEMIDRMMLSIEHLPLKQQLVLRLRHMDGLSTAEISKLTGDSEVAIRQSLSRARQGVRRLYTKSTTSRK